MHKSAYFYDLPEELIAQSPLEPRSASRLLRLEGASGALEDMRFDDLPGLLRPGDLLVFNDTRVIPARLFGQKETGGQVEVLIERVLDAHRAVALVRASKPPRPEQRIRFAGGVEARVGTRRGEFYELSFAPQEVTEVLEHQGHVPLPPYIIRADAVEDRERYQTVYARRPGAVAAPTAGLHFDDAVLRALAQAGVETAFVTLHVGAGTFQPVRVDDIREHRMHPEYLELDDRTCKQINAAKQAGRRVIAVGTTAVRVLESAARDGRVRPFAGETSLFIYPGYKFHVVDALVTNFHLPESTLLMLVCAFAGTDQVLAAYRHAVEQRYRFYSYGDAMFVTPKA